MLQALDLLTEIQTYYYNDKIGMSQGQIQGYVIKTSKASLLKPEN